MCFYSCRGPCAKIRIGTHLGHYKLVSEQYRPRSPLDWSNLAESSLVKNYLESSYISESRILFSPILCSREESWSNNFNSTPLLTQKNFRITRIFLESIWCRCDGVLSWCLMSDLISSGELSSRGFLSTSLSFRFLIILGWWIVIIIVQIS